MCPSLCPRPSGLAKLFPPPRRTALAAGCCAPLLGIRFTPKLALSLRLSSDPTKYRKFVPRRSGLGDFFAFCLPPLKILGIKVLTRVRVDAQGRPEGGVGRGGVYSVGPTPTLPLVRAPSFSRADAASPRRRPRVGPGRPQGTNPRNMSIARPRHDGLSIPRRKGLRFGFRGRAKRETGPRGPGRQFESTCLRRQLSGT